MQENDDLLIINNAIENDKLAHAYLFYAQTGIDLNSHIFNVIKLLFTKLLKSELPEEIDKIDDINYPDFKIIKPNQDGLILKEKVNSVVNDLYESALTKNKIKILYIQDIHLGNKHSLNSLLKFIEEPVKNLIILFSTNHFDQVIPTIKSRTQNIYVKPKSLELKINEMKPLVKDLDKLTLFANIYSNANMIKDLDQNLFNKTYNDLFIILEKAIDNPYELKTGLYLIWTKENNDFILNILQFFYYQIQITINPKWPLFPNHENLINRYKLILIDYGQIIKIIANLLSAIKSYGNFNLQKSYFLNEIEKIYLSAKS